MPMFRYLLIKTKKNKDYIKIKLAESGVTRL